MTSRPPLQLATMALVGLGGAVGASARHLVTRLFEDPAGVFPWATFAINVTGSFALAMLAALTVVRHRQWMAPLLGTGVLGGFTTLSAYTEQARALAAESTLLSAVYLLGTLAACLVGVLVASSFVDTAARRRFEAEEGDL